MKAAVIQFDIRPGDISANEKNAAEWITKAAEAGAELIVLPELWNCGYYFDDIASVAQDMRGSSIKLLQKLAKKHSVYIIGGSIAERRNGEIYNTSMAVNSGGEVVQKYRKVHLFPLGLAEQDYFSSGDEWNIIETPWGKIGMILCYDLRFAEFIRNLVLRGAQAIVVPAQWPQVREHHWDVLLQARAIENAVHIIAANRVGQDGSGTYGGHSAIVDPLGDVLVQGDDEAGFWLADIDFDRHSEVLDMIPVLHDRKAILDEIDNSLL